jgi:hypothetical protein
MTQDNYRNIPDLLAALQTRAAKLSSGELPRAELQMMLNETRELYERLIVLQYKAFEDEVKHPEPAADGNAPKRNVVKSTEQGKYEDQPKEAKQPKRKDQGLQLDFHSQAKMSAKEQFIPRNQVSLMDMIHAEERQRDEDDVVPQIEPVAEQEEVPEIAEIPEMRLPSSSNTPAPPIVNVQEEPVSEVAQEPVAEAPVETSPEEPEPQLEPAPEPSNTVNEQLNSVAPQSLADRLGRTAIADLKSAIGINQKFLFLNDLFEGESTHYNDALTQLNDFPTFDEAGKHLNELRTRFDWDVESASALAFVELIERRFL